MTAWPFLAQTDHNCFGPWQQEFKVGPFDLVATRYAIAVIGGVDALAITHMDKLLVHNSICAAYSFDSAPDQDLFEVEDEKAVGIRVRRPASIEHQTRLASALFQAHPEYEISSSKFVGRVEELLGVPVTLTSWGPKPKDKNMTQLCECGHPSPCSFHTTTPKMREALQALLELDPAQRGRLFCWFCPECYEQIPPGGEHKCKTSLVSNPEEID